MFHRIHSGYKDSGKWRHLARTGVGNVTTELYHGWSIELTHRTVGATIRRDQYTATLRRVSPFHEEQLPGFANKTAALNAAKKRIDFLLAVRRPFSHTRHTQQTRTSADG